MGNGIALAEFYLSEAIRLADAAAVSVAIDRAEILRKWLLENWKESEILLPDLMHGGPNQVSDDLKARASFALLAQNSWIFRLPRGTLVRGSARAESWRILKGGPDIA